MKALCAIDGCESPRLGRREWCSKHLQRWLKYGDPVKCATAYPERGATLKWIEEHSSYEGNDCLIWPFHRDDKGYGKIRVNKINHTASRVMCERVNGPPPTPELEAAHSCGKGHLGCVTPNHLAWATKLENEGDKIGHGTRLRHERHPRAKLTIGQVVAIRRLFTGQRGEKTALAKAYGVSGRTIGEILAEKKWRGING